MKVQSKDDIICMLYDKLKQNKVSVISGTTGWSIRKKNIHNLCLKNKVSFLHASNFSIGINLIKNIIPELNRFMSASFFKRRWLAPAIIVLAPD